MCYYYYYYYDRFDYSRQDEKTFLDFFPSLKTSTYYVSNNCSIYKRGQSEKAFQEEKDENVDCARKNLFERYRSPLG